MGQNDQSMGQNVPLCDSPYSLPHHLVVRLFVSQYQRKSPWVRK